MGHRDTDVPVPLAPRRTALVTSEFDNARVEGEGWGVFATPDRYRPFELRRTVRRVRSAFDDPVEVWKYVLSKAGEGSAVHAEAVLYMAEYAPGVLQEMRAKVLHAREAEVVAEPRKPQRVGDFVGLTAVAVFLVFVGGLGSALLGAAALAVFGNVAFGAAPEWACIGVGLALVAACAVLVKVAGRFRIVRA